MKVDGTEAAKNKLRDNLLSAISYEGERLRTARAVLDGSLVINTLSIPGSKT